MNNEIIMKYTKIKFTLILEYFNIFRIFELNIILKTSQHVVRGSTFLISVAVI